jgi:RND family efflux transporter MFP subunit
MASQVPGFAASLGDLAVALLSSSEVTPRARLIAQQTNELFPGSGIVVYILDQTGEPKWVPKATAGEVAFQDPEIPFEHGTLGAMAERNEAVLFSGADLPREDYAHLNTRRTLVSLAAIPLFSADSLVGAIEILSFDAPLGPAGLSAAAELSRMAGLGLAAGITYEAERNSQLESVTRLAQMYDLEKVFNSTLELDELTQLIASKFQELLRVQAVNLWMVEGDGVLLMSRTGVDPTTEVGTTQKAGEGMVGDIADKGEAVLMESPEDERLRARNRDTEDGAIFSLIAAPLMSDGAEVGVVEAVNKLDGTPFDEDDLFFLTTICETASNALHNASLLQAERKVEILETLVTVSQELTSTLNLDAILDTVVNAPSAVIPYDRAAMAMDQRGKLVLKRVSGMPEIRVGDADVARLSDILEWASASGQEVYVVQHDAEPEADREETRAKFRKYFSETGARAFYAIPLADDQGRLGILSFESSDPDFLTPAHLELIKVLAGQATVALRNSELYREVPLIGVIEPLMQKKRRFMALEKRRRTAYLVLAAAAAVFLVACPWPMRVDGPAVVAPARRTQVQPEVEGAIKQVFVHEGDLVHKGAALAQLEDWNYRAALAAAQAKLDIARSEMNRALAANDGSEAGIQQIQANYWSAEVTRAKERLERTTLRSPIEGVVATPHVEDFVGRHLGVGDTFAEVVDNSRASVDVALDESDVPLLQPGVPGYVKLDGFATRTFKGRLSVISPKGTAEEQRHVFFARLDVPNSDLAIRPGMQGHAKVWAGWHPTGYVVFRDFAAWVWQKLWTWFGW